MPTVVAKCGGHSFVPNKAMSDEAYLSAEQSGPRAAPRLSGAHGDGWRSSDPEGAPCTRSQEAVGLTVLTRRADFVAANAGRRAPTPGFVLLVRDRGDGDTTRRIGFTVTKKIGNAIVRNRMKRRFRALARDLLATHGRAGADHVMIGRSGGIEREFAVLRTEFERALTKLSR